MSESYRLVRDVPVEDGWDVLVSGGGPAGTAAAISAARLGAKVLLVEATGCLGGMATSGLVSAFNPMSDGERMLVGGVMREIVEEVCRRGWFRPGIAHGVWEHEREWWHFNAEGLKLILDDMISDAGVEVRFFTRAVDVEAAGKAVGTVVVHNIEGLRAVRAKTFIDATGDAVLASLAGVPCREAGRDTPNIMPPTLVQNYANIDWSRFTREGQSEGLERALADGHFTFRNRHLPGIMPVGRTIGLANAGHVYGLDALRTRSLSDGMMLGRKIAQEYLAFYRKYVPGCETMEMTATASLMGVRESRRIVGEYELDSDDFRARRHFPDQIGIFHNFCDIHPYDESDAEYKRLESEVLGSTRMDVGESFGIPYGIIVPKGWRNLWVPGRAASSDVQVHGAIRVQPACAMMGQAAGTAAVQSIRTGRPACDLDTAALVTTLREHGAVLPQETLASAMTR